MPRSEYSLCADPVDLRPIPRRQPEPSISTSQLTKATQAPLVEQVDKFPGSATTTYVKNQKRVSSTSKTFVDLAAL
ncbi:hypothetical protein VTL71DRAFT_6055 [Oculimacula yallundae]|uniref:Uncharacterized protein n=1 Tax=Oculimacula yallundae TaxID=86028 RepID=A0ABR4BZA6_9HELO